MNSKQKGNRTELKVAKWLTDWTGAEFNRVPMSGGLRWTNSERVAGDIIAPPDFYFPFVVEVKSRSKLTMRITKSGKMPDKNVFANFWHQAYLDCVRITHQQLSYQLFAEDILVKEPIVFARADYMPANTFYVQLSSLTVKVLLAIDPSFKLLVDNQYTKVKVDDAFAYKHELKETIWTAFSLCSSDELKKISYQDFITQLHKMS